MGAQISQQIERIIAVSNEKKALSDLEETDGQDFPGSDYISSDRRNWMSQLNPDNLRINKIVWPGTHDSATDGIGIPGITRPFAQCQTLSIYNQLVTGTRVLDIRVQENYNVCHGILISYNVDHVINDVIRFLSETWSEIIILEMRTEYGHDDPLGFDEYLEDALGEFLIRQDEKVFDKTVSEVLPKRVICVWKPRNSPKPKPGGLLWSGGYLRDDWIDTDLPLTKFNSNMKYLSEQKPVISRKYFYRVENTATPQADNPILCVKPVTDRIHEFARVFITQCFLKGFDDRLQILSTDFIDEDFVDACIGLTYERVRDKCDKSHWPLETGIIYVKTSS